MMQCVVREFYIMHQGIIYLGSMLNDAMWGQEVLYYASRNDICSGIMLNKAMWGQDVFFIMHQGMIYI